ncbi:hypothetical protein KKF81_00740 [Candidatus Micrarchaeota archaeon]|nr:hypothetical protein [Candidatus Micrarchaeota archaeon]MBU1165446.1 hypothetical protein [Candidatus Micrarchaeota archaeon]MBU1887427.1 hypothetical protein [Candidatus Micrarchaeota archaeon]
MKQVSLFLFLVLLSVVSFSHYPIPPMGDVIDNNLEIAQDLDGVYDPAHAYNSSIRITLGGTPVDLDISASTNILGPAITIDNITSPVDGLSIMIPSGHYYQNLSSSDYDSDGCLESVSDVLVIYDLDVLFSLNNMDDQIPLFSSSVEIPETIIAAMENASGSDYLNISVVGDVEFIYRVNDPSGPGCPTNYVDVSSAVPVSANASFLAGGTKKLFFLRSPVLREQWFRNNHFDVIVLSQVPVYYGEVFMNDNVSANFSLMDFDVYSDDYGLQYIISNTTGRMSGTGMLADSVTGSTSYSSHASNKTSPFQLEYSNNSFSYAYEFNFTYTGIGENNLSLHVKDSFLRNGTYKESLTSNALSSSSGNPEAGAGDTAYIRPSSSFEKDELSSLNIGLGLISLVLVLAFINFWIKK